MKKTISLILAIICMLALASCGAKETNVPDGMKVASGEVVDYNLYVPENWICDVASGATTAYYSDNDASNVSVMTYTFRNTDDTVGAWHENFMDDFGTVYSDIEVITDGEDTVLGGAAAKKYVFKGTLEGTTYQFMQVATSRKAALSAPQVYIFTYTSLPDLYENHTEDIQSMLDNFEFVD